MKVRRAVLEQIREHAKKEAPVEACGYLAAEADTVVKHYRLVNTDKSNEHFSFDPAEQFSTMRQARSEGLQICAVYHSHPFTPARPSREDIKLAFDPDLSYVIVSLADKEQPIRSFKLKDSTVQEETIEVV
jgi:proteasome lid subunit RPN8/RPN11